MNSSQQFIETIRVDHGVLENLSYHNRRANRTRLEVLDIQAAFDFGEMLSIPWHIENGLYKCRVTYGAEIDLVEFMPYHRRNIQTLKLVEGGEIEYRYKYADRSAIDWLFNRRGECDDILIVKDGLITDSSTANAAFYDGDDWYTPSHPLLAGTRRQQLLDAGVIKEHMIRLSDITKYSKVVLVNAMNDFDPRRALDIAAIHPL